MVSLLTATGVGAIAEVGTEAFRNVDRFTNAEEVPETLIVRFDGQLYFANLSYFQAQLNALVEEKKELKTVIINAEGISAVDSSAMREVHNFVETQHSKGINVVFAGLIGPVRDLFTKDGLISLTGPSNFYLSVPDAVKGASITQQNTSDHAIQANE
jgi:SulP family sulfate permease